MKLITAIIRPSMLDAVRQALSDAGASGLTVSEVLGYGRQIGHTELYRGTEYSVQFHPKLKIEAALPESLADKGIQAIQSAARSGKIGDGKIFVYDLALATRIRTGETNDNAL